MAKKTKQTARLERQSQLTEMYENTLKCATWLSGYRAALVDKGQIDNGLNAIHSGFPFTVENIESIYRSAMTIRGVRNELLSDIRSAAELSSLTDDQFDSEMDVRKEMERIRLKFTK